MNNFSRTTCGQPFYNNKIKLHIANSMPVLTKTSTAHHYE